MEALEHFVVGLAIVHGVWAYCYLWGTAVRRWPGTRASQDAALLDVVLASVAGLSIVGIATFFLGLCGLLYPLTPVAGLLALFAVQMWRGDSPLRAMYWRRRLGLIRRASTPVTWFVWVLGALRAVQSVVPDTGSDATVVYSNWAFEWAKAHALTVDYWIRFPWYPANWSLIEMWWFSLHISQYVEFLDAFAALLTMLGTYGFISWAARRAGAWDAAVVPAVAVIASAIFVLTPSYLHWEGIPMIDVPATLLLTVCCIAGIRAVAERNADDIIVLIVCAGFFAGIKVSYFAFLPLFAAFIWLAFLRHKSSLGAFIAATALMIALSSPWYVRDFVLSGDPLTPLLNVTLHGVDPKFSRTDVDAQKSDLTPDNSFRALISMPVEIFTRPTSQDYRDWGSPILLSLIWIPGIVAVWVFFNRGRRDLVLMLLTGSLLFSYLYWIGTAHTLRYAELFTPLLAMLAALVLIVAVPFKGIGRYASVVLIALCALPSPASMQWYTILWNQDFVHIGDYYHGRTDWLRKRSPAYVQVEYLGNVIGAAQRSDLHVYTSLNGLLNLFFREHGMTSIGDVFGPERMSDFSRALLNHDLVAWTKRLHVGAMLFDVALYSDQPVFSLLPPQLKELGWKEIRFPDSPFPNYVVYLSPALQSAAPAPVTGSTHP